VGGGRTEGPGESGSYEVEAEAALFAGAGVGSVVKRERPFERRSRWRGWRMGREGERGDERVGWRVEGEGVVVEDHGGGWRAGGFLFYFILFYFFKFFFFFFGRLPM